MSHWLYQGAAQAQLLSGPTAYTIAAGAGSYAVTGTAANLEVGRRLVAGAGSYTITGTAASLEAGRVVVAASGSYVLTGTAAGLRAGRRLAAGAGSYAITGAPAALVRGFSISAGAGAYVLTGSDATLTVGGVGAPVGDGGWFVLEVGKPARRARPERRLPLAVQLPRLLALAAEPGTYFLVGSDTTLVRSQVAPPPEWEALWPAWSADRERAERRDAEAAEDDLVVMLLSGAD